MSRILRVAAAALADLQDVRTWLEQDGAGAKATARLSRIVQAVLGLETSPSRWPVGQHPGLRERPIEGYRIMYEILPDTDDDATAGDVHVLRVFGPGQGRSSI